MVMQSLSQSWPKDISKALCNPSKMCVYFAWVLRLLDSGRIPVFVVFIVVLFRNCTVGPFQVSFMFVIPNMSSVRQ